MKIYTCGVVDGFSFVNHVSSADYELIWQAFKNREPGQPWTPPQIKMERDVDGQTLLLGDILGNDGRKFSGRAIAALGETFRENGEILPMNEVSGEEVFMFLPYRIDALDCENAELKLFSDGVRVMQITKIALKADVIGDRDAFRLSRGSGSEESFFSENFKSRVEAAGLRGFDFRLVWDSEHELPPTPKLKHPSQM